MTKVHVLNIEPDRREGIFTRIYKVYYDGRLVGELGEKPKPFLFQSNKQEFAFESIEDGSVRIFKAKSIVCAEQNLKRFFVKRSQEGGAA